MSDTSTKSNFIAKLLFIIGGVILFILLAIFILRLVPKAVSSLANIGSSIGTNISKTIKGEEIVISTNTQSVENGTPVVVNFDYKPSKPGQYTVSYACADGLFFDIQSNNGPKRIICNTPFKLGENLDSISLVPIVTKPNTFIDATIVIEYKDVDSNPIAKGSVGITVKSEVVDTTSTSTASNPFSATGNLSGSTVTTTPVPTQTVSVPRPTTTGTSFINRTKDLSITQITKANNTSGFTFNVYNLGNTATGPWEFSYTDAENPTKTLISPVQASLAGGQGLAITVRFDGQKNSNQIISVIADPYNQISETNESNNTGSVTITGSTSGSNNSDSSYNSNDETDLIITNLEVGRKSGNRFSSDDEISEDDTAAIRFVVKNNGGESTGSWKFSIDNLPYSSNDSYESKSYSSLQPGESFEIIADFDGIDRGTYSIQVKVDSDNDVNEEKENNNTESETLEVSR